MRNKKSVKAEPSLASIDLGLGQFSNDFLLYLLSRAHFQTSYPVRKECLRMGVSEPEYFCLSLLSMSGPISRKDIISRLEHTGHHPDSEIFARLKEKTIY